VPVRGTSISRSRLSRGQKSRAAIIDRALATASAHQFAFGNYAVMLAGHHFDRLMKAPNWQVRSRAAFELLLDSARKPERTFRPGPFCR
jgi:hypothetical protein